MSATSTIQRGNVETATKTPEMKYSGSMMPWVTGCAASWSWISDVTA